jgi:two-component system copper resistance phosphate regulon response regulator CusR
MARILVVDDDTSIHELLEMLLVEFSGHQTVAAYDGAKGLEIIASGEVFDLIITDSRMPVMTGPEMIAAIRGRGCMTPIIFMTGDVRPPDIDGVRLLRKPFTIDDFNGAVAEELAKNVR